MALGTPLAVDRHAASLDRSLRVRSRPERLGEQLVEPLARLRRGDDELERCVTGARHGQPDARRAPSSSTITSATTPSVIAMSAMLKAGQRGRLMKSVT